MKRIFFTAALAALALGTAQAVNVNWNYVNDAQNLVGTKGSATHTKGSYDFSNKIGDASTWAITCTFTLSDYTQTSQIWSVIVGLGNTNNDTRLFISPADSDIQLTKGDGTVTGKNTAGETVTDNCSAGITAQDVAYTIVFSKNNADANGVNVYLNGTLIGTITSLSSGGNWQSIRWGYQNNDRNTLDTVASWELSNLGYITESYEEAIASIPEPTALALLALGVAGVALRRRVD